MINTVNRLTTNPPHPPDPGSAQTKVNIRSICDRPANQGCGTSIYRIRSRRTALRSAGDRRATRWRSGLYSVICSGRTRNSFVRGGIVRVSGRRGQGSTTRTELGGCGDREFFFRPEHAPRNTYTIYTRENQHHTQFMESKVLIAPRSPPDGGRAGTGGRDFVFASSFVRARDLK